MGARHLLAKLFDPIAEVGRLLEIKFFSRLLHLAFQLIDQLRQSLERQTGIWIILLGLGSFPHHLHKIGIRAVLLELSGQLQKTKD